MDSPSLFDLALLLTTVLIGLFNFLYTRRRFETVYYTALNARLDVKAEGGNRKGLRVSVIVQNVSPTNSAYDVNTAIEFTLDSPRLIGERKWIQFAESTIMLLKASDTRAMYRESQDEFGGIVVVNLEQFLRTAHDDKNEDLLRLLINSEDPQLYCQMKMSYKHGTYHPKHEKRQEEYCFEPVISEEGEIEGWKIFEAKLFRRKLIDTVPYS